MPAQDPLETGNLVRKLKAITRIVKERKLGRPTDSEKTRIHHRCRNQKTAWYGLIKQNVNVIADVVRYQCRHADAQHVAGGFACHVALPTKTDGFAIAVHDILGTGAMRTLAGRVIWLWWPVSTRKAHGLTDQQNSVRKKGKLRKDKGLIVIRKGQWTEIDIRTKNFAVVDVDARFDLSRIQPECVRNAATSYVCIVPA